MKTNPPVVTIDGPAGSGKGTISQKVADNLGWHLLDSGALYRLVALAAKQQGIDVTDQTNEHKLTKLTKALKVEFVPSDQGDVRVFLEGEDVTSLIRTEECGNQASQVAAKKQVRDALLDRQRNFLMPPGLVADGRDMGTFVFPDAPVKIFLTASAEIRANRRLKQLKNHGVNANLRGLIRDIEERDARDTQRKNAPLVPAADATIIDTGSLSINEVVDLVLDKIKNESSIK